MNYISPDEGIAINVSYGDSLLHSETVKGPDPVPTCLNIFTRIAQMCARFRELLPTDDGLRGCVNLEPVLLGTVSSNANLIYKHKTKTIDFILDSIGTTNWLLQNGSKWYGNNRIIHSSY